MSSSAVFPSSNLGQGDQWARAMQTRLEAVEAEAAKLRQSMTIQSRATNTQATVTARSLRAVEQLEVFQEAVDPESGDLANRITALEGRVSTLFSQKPYFSASSRVLTNFALVIGANRLAPFTISVPAGKQYAALSVQMKTGILPSGTTTTTVSLAVDNAFPPGTTGVAKTSAAYREDVELYAETLRVIPGQTILFEANIFSNVAVPASASNSIIIAVNATFY